MTRAVLYFSLYDFLVYIWLIIVLEGVGILDGLGGDWGRESMLLFEFLNRSIGLKDIKLI